MATRIAQAVDRDLTARNAGRPRPATDRTVIHRAGRRPRPRVAPRPVRAADRIARRNAPGRFGTLLNIRKARR